MADLKAQLEIGADVSGVEAGISKAKKSINSLGVAVQDANSKGAKSIDRYVQSLQTQAATLGKSAREAELYKLALKGASDAQLKTANSALKTAEAFKENERIAESVRKNMVRLGVAVGASIGAAVIAFDVLIRRAGDFQDMSEKFGGTAQDWSSLALAAGTVGARMEEIGSASAKLTKNLTGVDDESKDAGAAIAALGLNLQDFKKQSPVDQMELLAKAMRGFEDGASKTAVAMALFGKSGAELLPFLKELGQEGGRQVTLTAEQIKLADEYADSTAKLRTQLAIQAQVIAIDLLPTLNSVGNTISDLANDQQNAAVASEILRGALGGAIVVFQTIAVVASEVGFVFLGVGREIGAIAAQLAALARLDFKGFSAISDAVKEDAERARAELDRFQAKVMGIGAPAAAGDADAERENARFNRQAALGRKKLSFTGADKKDTAADQQAKAQVALDLERIKAASEAITNVYSNAQKIMEAQRAAGLLDEQEYYAAKLGFLRLNASEQQRALEAEIARLQQEKLSGKDKLDNERKIAETRAKLLKVQQDATSGQIVLDTQAAAAIQQRASALLAARQAAKDYYDETQKQQARDLASVGLGQRQRDLNSGISQIEDRYANQRRDLENQRAQLELEGKFTSDAREQYDERLRIINEFQDKSVASFVGYYGNLIAQQGNWAAGATEALRNYADDSQNVFKGTEQAVGNAFQGMEDALVEFVKTGKLSFKDLANSIIADLARVLIKKTVTGPLAEALSGALSGAFGGGVNLGTASGADMSAFFASAKGNVFQTPGLAEYSNRVVNSPTLFAFAKGTGLMGEAGPEAIMPLRRGPDGRLGVDAGATGGGSTIHIHQNHTFGSVATREQVREEIKASERRMIAGVRRAKGYGGDI